MINCNSVSLVPVLFPGLALSLDIARRNQHRTSYQQEGAIANEKERTGKTEVPAEQHQTSKSFFFSA